MNFPTKRHWRDVKERGVRSLAVPALGSGLGGLPWTEVRERIERALRALRGRRILVFEPL
jgi:O-acetyl-ADP-ribose deacetylase (regulator of RNase III)